MKMPENVPDYETIEPFLEDWRSEYKEWLQSLLEKDPSLLNLKSPEDRTLLFAAIFSGKTEPVQLLLSLGANVNEKRGTTGWTPLHEAAFQSEVSIVSLLLAHQADVNAVDEYGRTALHVAAIDGFGDVVAVLLKAGADRAMQDKTGKTAYDWAIREGKHKIIALLKA